MSDNWRMSDTLKKAKIAQHCMNCNYYMGKEHNFEHCYKSDKGLRMICTEEMCRIYSLMLGEGYV